MSASRDRARCGLFTALAALLCVFALAVPASADEVIRNFTSNVELRVDGSVSVTEIIEIRAERNQINRGIYRDIPIVLVNEDGSRLRSRLDVISVSRDGHSEPYAVEGITNGVRIRIGEADVFLAVGWHTYEITYTMTRMARRFETYDELYWNATGNYWNFPIENAVANITLPEGAVISEHAFYTGATGETGQDATARRIADNQILFRTTDRLSRGEGLTVAVAFQKGVLAEPTGTETALNWLSDHRDLIVPGVGVFLVLLYYFLAWDSVGRDPRKGTIIPLFHPPAGFSPALVHFVYRMGWEKSGWTAFTAALVSLGVKGLVTIEKKPNGKTTTLTVTGNPPEAPLPPGEQVIFDYLRSKGTVTINKNSGPEFGEKRGEFTSILQEENRKVYFSNNYIYVVLGVVISIAALAVMVISGVMDPVWLILCLFAGVFMGIIAGFLHNLIDFAGFKRTFGLVWVVILVVNLGGAMASLAPHIAFSAPVIAAISIVIMNVVFAVIMRAPTVQGRKIMDQVEGFRMYLETAEKERLNLRGEPRMTVERFERILPYAIALGVETPWTEHFEGELARHAVPDAEGGYHPHWYRGNGRFSSSGIPTNFASIASGMSAAMTAAQPAPSSSSGSGGGGSSGGGGGGGGGGGW